ncbi:MAG: hypothetical protein FWG46_00330 [Treponema sp.]|nr:hypothetical protein [Treponema sp.]
MSSKTLRCGISLLLVFALFLVASCAELFQMKISAPGSTNTLDDIFLAQDTGKLATPTHFVVAQYYSATEIKLAWDETPRAAYYMVERAVSVPDADGEYEEPEDYEVLTGFEYKRFYTDEILNEPRLDSPEFQYRYYYRVSAYNSGKRYEESDPTDPQFAMLLRAPGNIQATTGTSDNVMITWGRLSGAVSYQVYRTTEESGANYSLLTTVPGNQNWYENKIAASEQGVNFFYMIKAINDHGNESLLTDRYRGFSRVFGAPPEPQGAKLVPGTGRGDSAAEISIQWDEVDAGASEIRYAVYRYYYRDQPKNEDRAPSRLLDIVMPPATSFTDTTAEPGLYYYYEVQAIAASGGRDLQSPFSTDIVQGFIISPPDAVIAEKSGSGIILKWTPPIGNIEELQKYTYNIFSGSSPDGFFSLVDNVSSSVGPDGYLSATVSGGPYFKVTTINGSAESVPSGVAAPVPAAAQIIEASRHLNFSDMGNHNQNGVYPVRITWKKPADDAPAFYHVQRSTRSGAGFAQINDTRLSADPFVTIPGVYTYDSATETYSYIDKNPAARVGRQFYYRVLSLNQLGQGSIYSDERIGWGAVTYEQYLIEFNSNYGGRSALTKLNWYNRPAGLSQLGEETVRGNISGTLHYNAWQPSLTTGRCVMTFTDYSDVYIEQDPTKGRYYVYNGATTSNTDINANGSMAGSYSTTGMYPGTVFYDNITLRSGKPAGGTYGVQMEGFPRRNDISWSLIAF